MGSTHDGVCALTCEGQLVLDQYLRLLQSCVHKIADENRKAAIPGANFSRGWVVADFYAELFGQDGYETPGLDLRSNTSDRVAVQRQDGSRKA